MMSHTERASRGGKATASLYAPKRERFLALCEAGVGVKRAAHMAGVADRTARRYRAEAS